MPQPALSLALCVLVWVNAVLPANTHAANDIEQPRKLLADRAWFSQLARIRHADAPAAVRSSDDTCLAVIEQLQPGTTLEGYELVERTLLLGVCRPTSSGSATAASRLAVPGAEQTNIDQQHSGKYRKNKPTGSSNSEANELGLALRPSVSDCDDMGDDDPDSDPHSDDTTAATCSSTKDSTVTNDGASNVCAALPLRPSSLRSSENTDVAPPIVLADGPTLEYQCVRSSATVDDNDEVFVNANYRLQLKFDAGSHGEVWKATRRVDGARFVLKRLFLQRRGSSPDSNSIDDNDALMVEMGLREAHFGRLLMHEPHVARFVEHFFRPRADADVGSPTSAGSDDTSSSKDDAQSDTSATMEADPIVDTETDTDSDTRADREADIEAETNSKHISPELWLVFRDEGKSLRSYLYTPRSLPHAGVVLEPSAFWRRLRTDEQGEAVFRDIVRQLLQSVAALHARSITHRDIKPSNILVAPTDATNDTAPIVRLADFGSAIDAFTLRHLYARAPSQREETREYQPPEVLLHSSDDSDVDDSSNSQPYDYNDPQTYDLWSVGVVVLEMLLGTPHMFTLSPRAKARLDASLPLALTPAQRRKRYLLHVFAHEFCIYEPTLVPSSMHRLRQDDMWTTAHAVVGADGCSFGKFNATVVARDPLHRGLTNPYGLDLIWKLLQWHPAKRISASDALQHAFFTGAYVCNTTGRRFATSAELALHTSYLAAQQLRDQELAMPIRERVEVPQTFACPQCKRRFATIASCEQHIRARQHNATTQFCSFDATTLQAAVAKETRAYRAAYPQLVRRGAIDSNSDTNVDRRIGFAVLQGRKKFMEDFVAVGALQALDLEVFAVADGHLGTTAAAFVAAQLFDIVTRNLAAARSTVSNSSMAERDVAEHLALRQTFLELQRRVLDHDTDGFSGCTLTLVLLFRTEQRVVAANVGDSRAIAVISRNGDSVSVEPLALTIDHWPNEPTERARIEASGGFIQLEGIWRVVGQLAVSRSLGDRHLRQFVSAEPTIVRASVTSGTMLVIASDGLWETMSSQEVAQFVRERQAKGQSVDVVAQRLVLESYVRGSQDNIAVVVVKV